MDIFWITLHDWKCQEYKWSKNRSNQELKQAVLNDRTIRTMITASPTVRKRVEQILGEMSHDWTLRWCRFLGYILTKIMKHIYDNVWVEDTLSIDSSKGTAFFYFSGEDNPRDLTSRMGKISSETPILYLPTHRSYVDFCIVSYICFALDLPIPSIAAGMDFLSLQQIASILRSCGAFFIRRSFRDDPIYWETFRSYVEILISSGERPIEFFLEGTRSRSGKSLPPKVGLLKVALDSFLKGLVHDLIIIPITISYDRILEEELYAKEVLPSEVIGAAGTKPKETPQNLIVGAQKILEQSYGSLYIRFCPVISVRQESYNFRGQDIRKSQHQEKGLVDDWIRHLAKRVVVSHTTRVILSSFDLFCVVILPFLPVDEEVKKIELSPVIDNITAIVNLIPPSNLSPQFMSIQENFLKTLEVHKDLFTEVCSDHLVIRVDAVNIYKLRIYANKALQVIFNECLYCYSKGSFSIFRDVSTILSFEFIREDEENSTHSFCFDMFSLAGERISRTPDVIKRLLSFHIHFFLDAYQRVISWMTTLEGEGEDGVILRGPLPQIRKQIQRHVDITSDIIDNVLSFLVTYGALVKATSLTAYTKGYLIAVSKLTNIHQQFQSLSYLIGNDENDQPLKRESPEAGISLKSKL